jgi:hypothetical protein
MIRLAVNPAAEPVVEIQDARGTWHAYQFALAPLGPACWAVSLIRADTGDRYRISEDVPGQYRCTCPSHVYAKRNAPPCKHVRAAQLVRSLTLCLERIDAEHCPSANA